jgi:hypothetical protein
VAALARCGRSTLTPAAVPALTSTHPGTRARKTPARALGWWKTSRACQGSSEADPSRIKWSQASEGASVLIMAAVTIQLALSYT